MSCLPPHLSRHQIQRFHPLKLIAEEFHNQLIDKSVVVNYDKGDVIFGKHQPRNQSYYLLSGVVEIRASLFSRFRIEATDQAATFPLEEKTSANMTALAKCQVKVLVFNRDYVDYLLARSQAGSSVVNINTPPAAALNDPVIHSQQETEPDWMWNLLQSPMFSKIAPANIQQMFSAFEDISVKAGDSIIQKGESGDYFYVIKSGRAKISLDDNDEETLVRGPGDYFGEDALVADAPRSASVTMMQDGILARLDQNSFKILLQQAIIRSVDTDQARRLLDDPEKRCILLDIRLASEFQHQHQPGSMNIPLERLRKKLTDLDQNTLYLVTDDGGRRSELATHWLNQHGLDSLLVKHG